MIKILFFIEKLGGGGAEKVLCDLVNHMDQSQFDITVQSIWPYEEGRHLARGVKYKSVYPVRNAFTEKIYRAEAAAKLTYSLHIKGDYDIECAFLEAGPTKILASSTNKNAKKYAWVHCDLSKTVDDVDEFARKTTGWYQHFEKIICVSENVKDAFDKIYKRSLSSVVLYNVINDRDIKQKSQQSSAYRKRRFTIVSVGRLMYQKGYDMLLRVHKRLLDEGYPHDLWIAGEGEDRPLLESYIQEHDLEDSVKLLGFLKNPYPMMKDADLLVCSSRWEGLSTFATEGVILGKPIVTTDCTGMRELLGDSEFGYIVPIDEDALLEGMRLLICDDNLRMHFEKKASMRGEDFKAEQLTAQVEDFFLSEMRKEK